MNNMKIIVLITFTLVATTQAALSTLRVGPRRRQVRNTEFEFGRLAPVDEEEAKRALQELNFAQNRMLYSASYPQRTMSMPLMGFSLPYSAFSLPYSTMSMSIQTNRPYNVHTDTLTDTPTDTLTDTPTDTPTHAPTLHTQTQNLNLPCVIPDLTNSPSINITMVLEVETLSGTTDFLDALAYSSTSAVSSSLSLCMSSGTRMLVGRSLIETKVTGVEVNDKTGVVQDAICTPFTDGASCSVVNLGLTVFASDDDSTAEAGQQVTKELQDQIEDGRLKDLLESEEVVALRIAQANRSPPSGNISAAEEGKRTPRGLPSITIRNTTIAIMSVALVAAVGLVVYKKTRPSEPEGNDAVSANCDESSISGATGDHSDLSILNESFHTDINSVSA